MPDVPEEQQSPAARALFRVAESTHRVHMAAGEVVQAVILGVGRTLDPIKLLELTASVREQLALESAALEEALGELGRRLQALEESSAS